MFRKYMNQKTLITFLCLIELALITSALISFSHKDVEMFAVGTNSLNNEMLALMVEDDNGEYKESGTNTFPPSAEYRYNQTKSSCMDSNQKIIENSISYDRTTKKVKVEVRQTAYCYLYFDQINYLQNYLIKHNDQFGMWQSGLEGDGYRFVGSGNASSSTTPKNFICFGTTNKDECVANPNTYMYRIIGVFKDETGTNHVKLIKYASLANAMAWNAETYTDTAWEASDLYKNLNGSTFLTNTTYVPSSTWSNKIANWRWTAVNTLTYESSGPDYSDGLSPSNIYLHEMNRSNKTSMVGTWTTPSAKIGLLYASDYTLSLGATAKNMTTSTYTNRTTLKTGWMHFSNNVNPSGLSYEWTISRCGDVIRYGAWAVASDGSVTHWDVNYTHAVRPVFYLTEYNEYKGGTGTISDPIILDDLNQVGVEATLNNNILSASFTKGDYELDSYCINNSLKTDDCVWTPITSTAITKTLNETNDYYVHVIDVEGYIAHSKGIYYETPSMAKDLIKSGTMWQSGLEGDGYRYTGSGNATAGTTPKNFVCFGTSNKSTCTGNPNTYIYRIIGVFPDDKGNQYVKLIKYANFPSVMKWNDANADVDWGSATLNANLNGGTFLTNTTYVPNATWSNKIANWKWSAVNTKTYSDSGPDYYAGSACNPTNIYLHEMNRSNKPSIIGIWTTPTAKIGLMYASDYTLSLGQSAKNMSGSTSTNKATLKTGWMHISNNLNPAGSNYEWTISRYGEATGYYAWSVVSGGVVNRWWVSDPAAIRPAFYLTPDIELQSGTGTISDPYIIKE